MLSFKVLILSAIVVDVLSYIYIIPPEISKSKDHENHCYYQKEKLLLKLEETKSLSNCEEITCNTDYSMTLFGCGSYSINDPNCLKFERDLSKPYPHCCNALICVEYVKDPSTLIPDDQQQVESNAID